MQFNLDYFYGNETSQFRFYRVPKALFGSDLSLEAVTIFCMMLDGAGLSAKNGWVDNLGRVFIYFVQKDVQKFLRCGHNRATAFMRELDRF
ncbi:MAG: replication initiator protein A, partial [Dysosmobacter sp.]|nr:replication initiator protein A [Dysosmobacter sp.]